MRWEFDEGAYVTAYGVFGFGPSTLPRMVAEIESLFPATTVVRRDMMEVYEERYREAAAMLDSPDRVKDVFLQSKVRNIRRFGEIWLLAVIDQETEFRLIMSADTLYILKQCSTPEEHALPFAETIAQRLGTKVNEMAG
ncbi:hypothetical protein AB1L30_04975 [Bremerella sp. JC817]|uniref:hypothetical protein n=1 Tax=Bremerella sp. JC817 TaxID=3231756 RepID=UPI00345B1A33